MAETRTVMGTILMAARVTAKEDKQTPPDSRTVMYVDIVSRM
jgi:hypothetical protein